MNENHILPLKELEQKELEDFQKFDEELRAYIKISEDKLKQNAESFFSLLQQNDLEDKDYKWLYTFI